MKRKRIAIVTLGRFHVLQLACELDRIGHEVQFYSNLPRRRAKSFGLPARCHVNLLPILAPLAAWERFGPNLWTETKEVISHWALNRVVIARLEPCDEFIGMSGLVLEAARYARARFGARIWVERGSRHILSQKEILASLPGASGPSDYVVRRELAGYELAERITVPSRHVADSFARDPTASTKLFLNPYGVDLNRFPRVEREPTSSPTLLFVGAWSFRKGADILVEAVSAIPSAKLIHVGSLGDAPFPTTSQFEHYDSVPQHALAPFYAAADIFVLASREEGLAMVQAQALASGLPLVCTDRTGGADLALGPALTQRILAVPHANVAALRDAIVTMIGKVTVQDGLAPLDDAEREALSWVHYGRRYAEELERE